jgi:hypothetical protein
MSTPSMSDLQGMFTAARRLTAAVGPNTDSGVAEEMRLNRVAKTSAYGGSISMAHERPTDPMFYWRNSNLPYDIWKHDELAKVREFCRILYLTHPVIGSVIDVFSTYPLVGMELVCPKSDDLADFYNQLFLDDLGYEDYLIDVGKEYWKVGEAFPLGSFNELLGTWEADELMLPEDVKVVRSPFLKEPRFEMKLPAHIRKIINDRKPEYEYRELMTKYPELARYATSADFASTEERDDPRVWIPVSNMVMSQVKHRGDFFHERGVPILLRAFRPLVQEEMLNAAQDAIASRLYTPLILAKIGASASDLGTDAPWVPTSADLDAFATDMNAALAADFRLITHHFAVSIENVFGRENMPDLNPDFERLQERMLQAFGMSKTMLSGASCLTGDTMVHVRRAGKGFRMKISDVVARFNGDDDGMAGRKWDPAIPTYIGQAHGRVVRSGLLGAAWVSGMKPVFKMTTVGGREIRASAQHPFLTEDGRWVELGDLKVGDALQVNDARDFERKLVPKRAGYATVKVKYHPHQVSRGARNGVVQYTVPMHRLVVEAALNEMPLYQMKAILVNDPIRSKELIYLPASVEVHHVDGNPRNNHFDNLQVMTKETHVRHHLREGGSNFVMWRVGVDKISSIVPDGEEMTYDLGMADAPHNFIANGFVVHNSGETYAADAMNRDLLTQLLSTFQKRIKRFVRRRAEVVAEAQGHYDFEMKGGRAVPVMEEVVETNPESGEQRIVRQPKLLLPDLRIRSMNLKDEENFHALLEGLREAGVPISMRTRLVNVPVDLEEEMEATKREQVAQAVAAQETRRETYLALRKKNLPIPDDLKADFEPKVIHPGGDQAGAGTQGELPLDGEQPLPTIGYTEPAPMVALVPTQEDILAQEKAEGQGGESNVTPMPMNRALMVTEQQPTNRVPESDEMRADMPKASALDDTSLFDPMRRVASRPVEDDDRIQMISRIVASEEEGGEDIEEMVPVIGSYHTRHLANRRAIEAWFMAPEWNPSAPEGETV